MAIVVVCARSRNQGIPNIKLFRFRFNGPMGNYLNFGNCFGFNKLLPKTDFENFISAPRNNLAWTFHYSNRYGFDMAFRYDI